MRKIATLSQLFPPPQQGTYEYFEGASSYPFDPNTTDLSAVNAWWMAELSLLVYSERHEVEQILYEHFPASKLAFFWLESNKTNTQGFGIETDDYVVIAFRGTEFPHPSDVIKTPQELLDIIADIQTDIQRLSPLPVTEGAPTFNVPVHPGFAQALQRVWEQIQVRLTANTKPLWLTGHSLGAAIATLLAYQLPERVKALYTFGSPCVGTIAFVNSFNEKGLGAKTYRYLHGKDAVANVLEKSPLLYDHVGQLIKLDAGERRGMLLQAVNTVFGSITNINLLDHPPILYSYECWNAIP